MKKNKNNKTTFLLPSVNFLTGMGSIFNISGNYYRFNTSNSGAEADCKALNSDWKNIGQDFYAAFEKIK
jgi:hypothetical protein